MISAKLKPAGTKFLTCPRCRETIEKCPICGKTTETKPMEKDGIINHIQNNLGIKESEYYTKLNNMRNSIFHWRTTEVKPRDIMNEIQKLKYCLITAYHFLIYGSVPKETSDFIKNFTALNQEVDILNTVTFSKEGVKDIAEKYTYFNVDPSQK